VTSIFYWHRLLDRIPTTTPIDPRVFIIMSDTTLKPAIEYKELEKQLDELLRHYHLLKTENESLKIKQESLVKEKAKLLAKTSLAKTKVEAMITRLKAMEESS
jgi:cell division protein ZapB